MSSTQADVDLLFANHDCLSFGVVNLGVETDFGHPYPTDFGQNRLWPKPTLAKTDFGQTDFDVTDVTVVTVLIKSDTGMLWCVVLCRVGVLS